MEITENLFDKKIDINLITPEDVTFKFQKLDIIVRPYINMENKYVLIDGYANVLKNDEYDDTRKYVEAEYALKLGIVDKQTNINIETIDIDKILSSGLFDKVIENVTNYQELREDIAEIVNRVNDSKSVSVALVKLTDKVIETLEKINQLDLSQEGITTLLGKMEEPLKKIREFYPVVESGEKVVTASKRKPKNNVVL
jgi:hypothetical protein